VATTQATRTVYLVLYHDPRGMDGIQGSVRFLRERDAQDFARGRVTHCSAYDGRTPCNAAAEVCMQADYGAWVPGGHLCMTHALRCSEEYLAKLGETWPLFACDEYGAPTSRQVWPLARAPIGEKT
jgi:hypothetical protein